MTNRAYRIARWLDRILTGGFYLAFLLEILLLSLSAPSRGGIFLLCAALAFSFTWLLRRLLGMKRPYQNESVLLQPRRGTNDSFPSLHAFSAFFIATSAFTSCSGLTSISLPEGLLSIHAGAFTFCSSLTSVTIPNTVESIGERAFSFCSALTAVTIPKSVTAIGPRAFAYGSAKLTIYTEHAQKPEGWDAAWSEGARSVVFDAK